tara:strand:+ start:346 stop:666 length:321 start_codon:yes stop_codon:yes gene_type:complete
MVVDVSATNCPDICNNWDFVTSIGEIKVTVNQLIERLQEMPQDNIVVIRGYEGGVDEVTVLEDVRVELDVNAEWNYGSHEVLDRRDRSQDENITGAVYLRHGMSEY